MRGRGRDDVTTAERRANLPYLPYSAATERSPKSVDEDINELTGNVLLTTSPGGDDGAQGQWPFL